MAAKRPATESVPVDRVDAAESGLDAAQYRGPSGTLVEGESADAHRFGGFRNLFEQAASVSDELRHVDFASLLRQFPDEICAPLKGWRENQIADLLIWARSGLPNGLSPYKIEVGPKYTEEEINAAHELIEKFREARANGDSLNLGGKVLQAVAKLAEKSAERIKKAHEDRVRSGKKPKPRGNFKASNAKIDELLLETDLSPYIKNGRINESKLAADINRNLELEGFAEWEIPSEQTIKRRIRSALKR